MPSRIVQHKHFQCQRFSRLFRSSFSSFFDNHSFRQLATSTTTAKATSFGGLYAPIQCFFPCYPIGHHIHLVVNNLSNLVRDLGGWGQRQIPWLSVLLSFWIRKACFPRFSIILSITSYRLFHQSLHPWPHVIGTASQVEKNLTTALTYISNYNLVSFEALPGSSLSQQQWQEDRSMLVVMMTRK